MGGTWWAPRGASWAARPAAGDRDEAGRRDVVSRPLQIDAFAVRGRWFSFDSQVDDRFRRSLTDVD
ncbi:MAG: hypothetical protein ABJA98_19325 [Acidobacteriota bacterium]